MFSGKLMFFLLCLLHSRMLTGSFAQAEWSYDDPQSWVNDYPTCGGANQSPINIDAAKLVDRGFHRSIYVKNYDVVPTSMTMANDGRSVSMTAKWANDDVTPYLGGGHLRSEYIFGRMEIHSGQDCINGSEHTLNGRGRCLELQMIHWNYEARSFENSTNLKNGRVIISLLGLKYNANETSNVGLNALGKGMKKITEPGSETEIEPFALADLRWDFIRGYQTYKGSMTFPPCEEVVDWLFPVNFMPVGYNLLDMFRSVKLTDGTNNRPTQPMGDRIFEQFH